MEKEQTLIIIKPDGIEKRIIGKIISYFEEAGLKVVDLKFTKMSKEEAEQFYNSHKGKHFYEELINFISCDDEKKEEKKILAMILEGTDAISRARQIIGATNPAFAKPHTIRGTYGESLTKNVVHASDTKEAAEREIKLLFK